MTCLADRIGNFVVGKEFDALVIDTRVGPMFVEEGEALESLFEKVCRVSCLTCMIDD